MTERILTGRHVLAITVSAFAVIIGVNVLLAVQAVRTFPGLEVKNSYVASQSFDRERRAQEALGWSVRADSIDGMLHLAITDRQGRPVKVDDLAATVGRATEIADDQTPDFRFDGTSYVAPINLGRGNWNIRMEARAADGTLFRQRVVLHLKG